MMQLHSTITATTCPSYRYHAMVIVVAACPYAAAPWQALLLFLLHHQTRGHGTSQYEVPLPVHLVLCKKVPEDVQNTYYRVHGTWS